MPASSRFMSLPIILLMERPRVRLRSSIERGTSARYRAATICPPRRVTPGKLAAISAPTPSSNAFLATAPESGGGAGPAGLGLHVRASVLSIASAQKPVAPGASPYLPPHAYNPDDPC